MTMKTKTTARPRMPAKRPLRTESAPSEGSVPNSLEMSMETGRLPEEITPARRRASS